MIGWRDDPLHQQLTAEIAEAHGDEAKLEECLSKQASLRRSVPFREYVEKALAVYIAPYDYSYRGLTLAVAQQLGSSHEDLEMDEPLVTMQSAVIGRDQGHVAPLIGFADLVLKVGLSFLKYLREKQAYRPRYRVE